jgi:site-specific recombinase XerC
MQKNAPGFFAAHIRNRNTREGYLRAVRNFLDWAEPVGVGTLLDIEPMHVATGVELKMRGYEAQSVKQQLAALRHFFDWLVMGQVLTINRVLRPRSEVLLRRRQDTDPVAERDPAADPRDPDRYARRPAHRALIGLMVYTFARASATVGMNVKDVFPRQDAV